MLVSLLSSKRDHAILYSNCTVKAPGVLTWDTGELDAEYFCTEALQIIGNHFMNKMEINVS